MTNPAAKIPICRVAAWIDDIAGHARAAEAIAGLGSRAIGAIADYLRASPQVIPQPRCFAVAMLARLDAAEARAALREVLHSHRLRDLAPQLAESEYVVKNDAMQALLARRYPELAADVAFGIQERLPAAVRGVAQLNLSPLASALVALLDDDVLADTAAQVLTALGTPVSNALLARLDNWLWQSQYSARLRLATIRGLLVLAGIGPKIESEAERILRRALRDPHPLVQAAAALVLWPNRRSDDLIPELVCGTLGHDRALANACCAALAQTGLALVKPALRAVQRDAEPDLYGRKQAPPEEQRRWLVARMIERAVTLSATVCETLSCDPAVLADAISHSPSLRIDTLRKLLEEGDARIRAAVVWALAQATDLDDAAALLVDQLADTDRQVRRAVPIAMATITDAAYAARIRARLARSAFTRGCWLRLRCRLALLRQHRPVR